LIAVSAVAGAIPVAAPNQSAVLTAMATTIALVFMHVSCLT
jgi:hypothetical protein